MSIEKYIPIFAPAPPAVVIGLQLYKEVMHAAPDPSWWWIAAAAAIFGMVGTIGAEMISYKAALRAWSEKEKGAAFVAAIGAVITSALIIWAISKSPNAAPLIVTVLVAIVAYSVSGVRENLEEKKARRVATQANTIDTIDAQTKLERERAKIASANARAAKFANGTPAVRAVREQDEHQPNRLNPELLAQVRAYLKQNPSASIRETGSACGIKSSSTAKKYIDIVRG